MDNKIIQKSLDILGPKVFGQEYLTYQLESKRIADEMLTDWINTVVPVIDLVRAEEELLETLQILDDEETKRDLGLLNS